MYYCLTFQKPAVFMTETIIAVNGRIKFKKMHAWMFPVELIR